MDAEFEWMWGPMRVEQLEGFSDVITGIYWICLAKYQGYEQQGKESGLMELPPPHADSFIPLADINATQIGAWIAENFDKAPIEAICLGHLESVTTKSNISLMSLPAGSQSATGT